MSGRTILSLALAGALGAAASAGSVRSVTIIAAEGQPAPGTAGQVMAGERSAPWQVASRSRIPSLAATSIERACGGVGAGGGGSPQARRPRETATR